MGNPEIVLCTTDGHRMTKRAHLNKLARPLPRPRSESHHEESNKGCYVFNSDFRCQSSIHVPMRLRSIQ